MIFIDIFLENSNVGDQNLNPFGPSNKETDCFTELKTFRFKNPKKLIMGHLNINSLRNKFESINSIISPNFDIFLDLEIKLDETFPNNQFSISGYRIFRQDRNCLYIRKRKYCVQSIKFTFRERNRNHMSRDKHTIKKLIHCRFIQDL